MEKTATIAFTGDIGFDRYFTGKWNDEQVLDDTIRSFLAGADHVIANVEGAMLDYQGPNTKGIFMHTMDPGAQVFLNRIRADIWNLNNNHTMDAGAEGLLSTIAAAKKNGARPLGAGDNAAEAVRPFYLREAGGIGLVTAGYQPQCVKASETSPGVVSWDDFEHIEAAVREIKNSARWCVLIVHGGEEFCNLPMPYIRDRYLRYLDMGVDIIVGHHPHVPQNIERFESGQIIFYSLGNFIFDTDYQRVQFNTDRGVLLRLHFTEDRFSYDALGLQLERGIEHLTAAPLPGIFAELTEADYQALLPLAAQAMLSAEQRRQINMHPETYTDYTQAQWDEFFADYLARSGEKSDMRRFRIISEIAARPAAEPCTPAGQAAADYIRRQLGELL